MKTIAINCMYTQPQVILCKKKETHCPGLHLKQKQTLSNYYNLKCKSAAINLILKSLSPQPLILFVAAASKWDKPPCCMSTEWNGWEQCLHFITVNL